MSMMVGIKKGPKSDINITPYIDILLVLLIIFMVVTPIRQQDLKVKVPQAAPPQPQAKVESDAIVVTVREHGQIDINRVSTDFGALDTKLREIFSARSNKSLFINGGPTLPYSDIVRVIDIAKGAGVADIGLMSNPIGPIGD